MRAATVICALPALAMTIACAPGRPPVRAPLASAGSPSLTSAAGASSVASATPHPSTSSPSSSPRRSVPPVPSGRPAVDYRSSPLAADSAAVPADPLRDAIRGTVREGAREGPVATRGRRAPRRRDERPGARAGPGRQPASEAVDFLLAYYGIVNPSPQWLIERATLGAGVDGESRNARPPRCWMRSAATQAARLGIGIDRGAGELRIVVGVAGERRRSGVRCRARFRKRKPVDDRRPAAAAFHDPALVVTAPDGTRARAGVARRRTRGVRRRDGLRRRRWALSGRGDRRRRGRPGRARELPDLLRRAAAGRGAPVPAGVLPVTTTAAAAEDRLLALVNRDRAAAGLAPLAIDARLAEAARAHSRDMAEHEFVAHISPTTGSAVERVARVGLRAGPAARERRPRLLGGGRRERIHGQPGTPRQYPRPARPFHRHRRRGGPRAGRLGPAVRDPTHDVTGGRRRQRVVTGERGRTLKSHLGGSDGSRRGGRDSQSANGVGPGGGERLAGESVTRRRPRPEDQAPDRMPHAAGGGRALSGDVHSHAHRRRR